jgi:hypothetical protein
MTMGTRLGIIATIVVCAGLPSRSNGHPCSKRSPIPPVRRTPAASRDLNCYCRIFVPSSSNLLAKVVKFTKKTFLFVISRADFRLNLLRIRTKQRFFIAFLRKSSTLNTVLLISPVMHISVKYNIQLNIK